VDIPARVLSAMRCGASGYILKPFHAAELARAVEDVLSGEAAPISPRAAKVLLSELRGDAPDQKPSSGPALSKRELEVLQLLVHGHTYADVAQALGIAEGTVQTYVKRIYEKMDVSTKAEAALLAGAPDVDPRGRSRAPGGVRAVDATGHGPADRARLDLPGSPPIMCPLSVPE
jgi:DNA-binding NarL/FixJ family response regulator